MGLLLDLEGVGFLAPAALLNKRISVQFQSLKSAELSSVHHHNRDTGVRFSSAMFRLVSLLVSGKNNAGLSLCAYDS